MVAVEKLAEGVFYLTGGSHHSLAIEMRDHIVVVDTPQTEARASAVLAKAKETIPNKPIRFVVTSHHHWDHLGGIRTAIDEGATIVTHQSNKAFLERVAKTPHTLGPDRLAASRKAVRIQTVGDRGQLTDGTRTIELHRLQNYEHTGDMLIVYLPKEKILAEPDAFTPPAPNAVAHLAGRGVREGAARQHPAAEARCAGDRALPRQPEERRRGARQAGGRERDELIRRVRFANPPTSERP